MEAAINVEKLPSETLEPASNIEPPEDCLALKREPVEPLEEVTQPENDPSSTPAVIRAGRVSKTGTPTVATFSEANQRTSSRNTRAKDVSGNGSHASSESGYGAQATTERVTTREKRRRESAVKEQVEASKKAEVPAPVARDSGGGVDDEIDPDDEEVEENEPRYCYCNEVSYGEMVACDNEECEKQWFHLRCAGLKEAPTSAKWYCDDCKLLMKESRRNRPGSRRE